jgi:hypothetical protein
MSVSTEPESSPADLTDLLTGWLQECHTLRGQIEKPDLADGVHAIHRQLLSARRALDRMEAHLTRLIRLKARTNAVFQSAKWTLEEAEAKAYDSRKLTFNEYATGKEKEAWVATQTTIEKMALRKALLRDSEVGAALEEVKVLHRGVDSIRRDADTRLRIITFERSLER